MLTSIALALGRVCDVVRDFGAAGDNHTEDTAAVAAAIAQCDSVQFPAGYKFLLRPIRLRSHQQLIIDGTLVAWPYLTSWPNSTQLQCTLTPYLTPAAKLKLAPQLESLLWGANLTNVSIRGSGTLDGQGWRWWPKINDTSHGAYWHTCRPHLLYLGHHHADSGVTDLTVSGITLKDSPFWTFTAKGVKNVHIRGVTVTTTGCGYAESPNTDGFNVGGDNILIEDSTVRNGDDCVALSAPSRNVTVRNLTCSCGNGPTVSIWPRFSIPNTSAGVARDVTFDQITLVRTSNAVSLKSYPSFLGQATNVSYTNMRLEEVEIGIAVNFFGQGAEDAARAGGPVSASASSLRIENVSGTVRQAYGHLNCGETAADEPCTGLRMHNVTLKPAAAAVKPYTCMNAHGVATSCQPEPCLKP